MKVIGLTGRSGCGKSTVATYFAQNGVYIVDADEISRHIYEEGSPLLPPLLARFGSDLWQNGTLNRRALADRAFATPEGTRALTELTHPEINRRVQLQFALAREQGCTFVLLDAAVLIGSVLENCCDKIVLVTAPRETSIKRIESRDGISCEMAARRLDAQKSEAELIKHADWVIQNNDTLQQLLQKAGILLEILRKEANGQNTEAPKKTPEKVVEITGDGSAFMPGGTVLPLS